MEVFQGIKADELLQSEGFKQSVTIQQERIQAAAGKRQPDTIFKGAGIVNVFTGELEFGDVAVYKGKIVGVGRYVQPESLIRQQAKIIDCRNRFIAPGFIDGHIHIESSMLSPGAFAKAVVPHGTTAVITDPHEIVNVAGRAGLRYMLKESEGLSVKVYVMLPSCVPATPLEESGAVLQAEELLEFMGEKKVLGLAEVMNFLGTVSGEEELIKKLELAKYYGKIADGHAPGLRGKDINAYCMAGIESDHECGEKSEALEKLRRGQWIMIREGTAARNMESLKDLLKPPYSNRCMLVTDDRHPGDLLHTGHLDYLLCKATEYGANPITAIQMVTLHPAQYFGLKDMGAIAPGYCADMVILKDLVHFTVDSVYKDGKLVAKDGGAVQDGNPVVKRDADCAFTEDRKRIFRSFHCSELKPSDFYFKNQGSFKRIMELVPGELITKELILPCDEEENYRSGIKVSEDIIKLAVIERHLNTGHIGIGLMKGYGLQAGAVASSIAHDSHNIIVAGTTEEDMSLAANCVRAGNGGLAVVRDGKVLGELPLPIGGLMSEEDAGIVDKILEKLKEETYKLGIKAGIDPFMTLAFLSLSVIPKIKLTTKGLADAKTQEILPVYF
ncbi:adenine deaminase [Anaerocolumna xylanovorans]|uniref:Adenine deaminase n=1 Tax=Anaerocolumna xylanovorans DSM 12503 TaxID=1121345 RepID=A0A1M7YN90_9FIRM|nr:adenine deaminase [Anaerocolumna xylanovorans]SHO54065.1 Adenine deaminase [Anaerocolumna xylanovorans DSM 12503]